MGVFVAGNISKDVQLVIVAAAEARWLLLAESDSVIARSKPSRNPRGTG